MRSQRRAGAGLIRAAQAGGAGAPHIFHSMLSEEKQMQTPDSLLGFKGCRSQAAGTVRGLGESQPAYYTERSCVAHYNLCPRAGAIARNVETMLGCGLTNTILASAKMSSYFLLVLLCTGDQLSWELFNFVYTIAK